MGQTRGYRRVCSEAMGRRPGYRVALPEAGVVRGSLAENKQGLVNQLHSVPGSIPPGTDQIRQHINRVRVFAQRGHHTSRGGVGVVAHTGLQLFAKEEHVSR